MFADLAARLDGGEPVDLEKSFAEHPALESKLRRLHSGWRRADRLLSGLHADSSVLDSAARELSPGAEAPDAATREEIERLSSPDRARTR